MKIIVVGMGKVGYTVAEQLVEEAHDVTVVDTDRHALDDALSSLDVMGIVGNGASYRVLEEAGIADCDLLIAITGSDEINLLCCLLASKKCAGSTIARVRNPEYSEELELIKDSLGLSMAVNPDREAAKEIMHILKYPSAMNVESFPKSRMDLVSFVADKRCSLCGSAIMESFPKLGVKALICAVEREDKVTIPDGRFVIEENDVVAVLAAPSEVPKFFKKINIPINDVKNTMIVGGGRIAYYLAERLSTQKMKATIIEKKEDVAENLSFLLPDANVVCGDGTNSTLLMQEGIQQMNALCCLTGMDEENILLSMFAKKIAPKIKTITKVNRVTFQEVIRNMDIGSVIYPKYMTASSILQYVRAKQNSIGSNVETLYRIIDNKAEALEFNVGEGCVIVNTPLEILKLKKNVLIGCIKGEGRVFIPNGKDEIHIGDTVIVVTTIPGLSDLDDIKG